MKLYRLLVFFAFVAASSITILLVMDKMYPHETGKFISINSDGNGYYAYLPAIFINKNLTELPENKIFTNRVNERNVIKYPPGSALLQTPFFIVALVYSNLTGKIDQGNEPPFQIAIQIAAFFYLLLGLWFTNKVLANFNLKPRSILITLLVVFFGTNLLYYAIFKPSMSHVYSFSTIAGFVYFVQNYLLKKQLKWLLLATIALAVVVLIRPFNLIVLIVVPLFTRDIRDLKLQFSFLTQNPLWLLLAGLTGTLLLFIQPLMWYLQTDQWVLWSYKDEGFYFLKPEILNVLFSFKRGLFVYTPILLLAIPGLFILNKQNRWQFLWLVIFLLVLTYLISCWWNWYYGDGFGHRAFIDFFVLFAILIAFAIDKCEKNVWQVLIALFLVGTVTLNLIQTFQYRVGILHPHSMNVKKYRYVFLKTGSGFIHSLGGNSDLIPYGKSTPQLYLQSKNDFESEQENWEVSNRGLSSSSKNSKNHVVQFSGNEFGLKFNLPFDTKIAGCKKLWTQVSLSRFDPLPQSSNGTLLVIDKRNIAGESSYYYTFPINDFPSQKPQQIDTFHYSFEIPCLNNENEHISIYLWNQKKGFFEIDEISISIFRIQ